MPAKMSTIETAQALGVPLSTLRSWSEKLGIGAVSPSGKRTYSDDDLVVLATVRTLRNEDCLGLTTISRQLGLGDGGNVPQHTEDDGSLLERSEQEPPVAAPAIDIEAFAERLTLAVTATIQADKEQAERYARAAHRVGALEAENAALRVEVAHLRSILSLPLWRYALHGRRMLAEAPAGHALPPGTEQAPS